MKFATVFRPLPCEGLSFSAPSLTQQQFKAEQDISNMIRRALSGDSTVFRKPQYINALFAPESFHDASNRTAFARTVWEEMPDNIKATYGSPEALLADFDRQLAKINQPSENHDVSGSEEPEGTTPEPTPDNT